MSNKEKEVLNLLKEIVEKATKVTAEASLEIALQKAMEEDVDRFCKEAWDECSAEYEGHYFYCFIKRGFENGFREGFEEGFREGFWKNYQSILNYFAEKALEKITLDFNSLDEVDEFEIVRKALSAVRDLIIPVYNFYKTYNSDESQSDLDQSISKD